MTLRCKSAIANFKIRFTFAAEKGNNQCCLLHKLAL